MTLQEIKNALSKHDPIKVKTESGAEYLIHYEQTRYLEDDDLGACVIGWVTNRPNMVRKWRYLKPQNVELIQCSN